MDAHISGRHGPVEKLQNTIFNAEKGKGKSAQRGGKHIEVVQHLHI